MDCSLSGLWCLCPTTVYLMMLGNAFQVKLIVWLPNAFLTCGNILEFFISVKSHRASFHLVSSKSTLYSVFHWCDKTYYLCGSQYAQLHHSTFVLGPPRWIIFSQKRNQIILLSILNIKPSVCLITRVFLPHWPNFPIWFSKLLYSCSRFQPTS